MVISILLTLASLIWFILEKVKMVDRESRFSVISYLLIAPLALSLTLFNMLKLNIETFATGVMMSNILYIILTLISGAVFIYGLMTICKTPLDTMSNKLKLQWLGFCRNLTLVPAIIFGMIGTVGIIAVIIKTGITLAGALSILGGVMIFLCFFMLGFGLLLLVALLYAFVQQVVTSVFVALLIFSGLEFIAAAAVSIAQAVRTEKFRKGNILIKVLMILWGLTAMIFPVNLVSMGLLSSYVKKPENDTYK